MATLNIKIPHKLTQDEALKRIKTLLSDTKEKYGDVIKDVEEKWKDTKGEFSFSVQGYKISGTILVTSSEVTLTGELPWALSLFKGKIEKIITERAYDLLA